MTVIGALSSFRELGEMIPHKRASVRRTGPTGMHWIFKFDLPLGEYP
jgi:hypothetical protein